MMSGVRRVSVKFPKGVIRNYNPLVYQYSERRYYKRICDKCSKLYRPVGRQQKLCEDCRKKLRKLRRKKYITIKRIIWAEEK